MKQSLLDYYKFPSRSLPCSKSTAVDGSREVGFFQFGEGNICYGACRSGVAPSPSNSAEFLAAQDVHENRPLNLPFDFNEVIDNLRMERYASSLKSGRQALVSGEFVRGLYYLVRPILPSIVRRQAQRVYFHDLKSLPFPEWPVDCTVDRLHECYLRLLMRTAGIRKLPFIWFWPDGVPSCLIMTHDVETRAGRNFSSKLMDLDDSFGIKASFQIIPEKRYRVSKDYLNEITTRGFELNVHDLNHDGHLYRDRSEFLERAAKINTYVRQYQARGFRAGAMYRNVEWYDVFEFSYDMSVPNVGHLEPMRGGCCTVMPYFIGRILELPLTAAQDYSVFHILKDSSMELWKRQLGLIRERSGLISFIIHPDYVIHKDVRKGCEALFAHLRELIEKERIWHALPSEVDRWWRARNEMQLVPRGNSWEIVGSDSARARLAYAVLDGDRIAYEPPVFANKNLS